MPFDIEKGPQFVAIADMFLVPLQRSCDICGQMRLFKADSLVRLTEPLQVFRPVLTTERIGPDDCAIAAMLDHGVTRALQQSTQRSEEHTSELQSLMRIAYGAFCLK